MATNLPETTHFGFTRVGAGEAMSKNGWASSDGDRTRLDNLFYAALTHTHNGDPALGSPSSPPTLTTTPTGGHLPAASTFYYRVSYIDRNNLETAASPEVSISTPNPIAPPTAPASTVEATSGTVAPGIYNYLIAYVDAYGGLTTPSPLATATVSSGTTSRVRLDMPGLPTGAASINVYRSRPGQSQFYYLGNTATGVFYDTGAAEDQTVQAPTLNTTNNSNSITITIPGDFIPLGCFSWKIYRATQSGAYTGNSLVHWVVEGLTDTSTTPRTNWSDTGDALLAGFPSNSSSTAPDGSTLSFSSVQGEIPLAALPRGGQVITTFSPSTITNSETVTVTESPSVVKPVRFTAYFKTDVDSGKTVRFRFTDSGVNAVQTITEGGLGLTSFTLTLSGNTTTSLSSLISAEGLQTALEDLTGVGVGNVLVTGNPSGPYTVEFTGSLANSAVATMTATPVGGTGTVAVAATATGSTTGSYVELSCNAASFLSGDPAGYYHVEFPLIDNATFEAETGTRSPDNTTVPVVSDLAAISGQAVALTANNAYVQVRLGVLDKGSYHTFVTERVLQYAASSTDDLVVSVYRLDTNVIVGSATTYTLTDPGDGTGGLYYEKAGPAFTALGGVEYALRIGKGTATTQAYNVSSMRFTATVPVLKPGLLTCKAFVDGGSTTAANATVALWF